MTKKSASLVKSPPRERFPLVLKVAPLVKSAPLLNAMPKPVPESLVIEEITAFSLKMTAPAPSVVSERVSEEIERGLSNFLTVLFWVIIRFPRFALSLSPEKEPSSLVKVLLSPLTEIVISPSRKTCELSEYSPFSVKFLRIVIPLPFVTVFPLSTVKS